MPIYTKDFSVNKKVAIGLTVGSAVLNLLMWMNGHVDLPYVDVLLPFANTLGLFWVGYGLWKEQI